MVRASSDRATGRAIVTHSRSWPALAAIRSLGQRGIEVVAGDEYAITPGSLSRYTVDRFEYPPPASDPEGFVDALDDAVAAFAPAADVPYALLPIYEEILLVARARQRFEGRIAMAIADAPSIESLRHKIRLTELAREYGIQVPAIVTPKSVDELANMLDAIELPAFVKLPVSAGGLGVRKVHTREELLTAFEELAHVAPGADQWPLVQQAIEGDDYCVTALFAHGEPRASLTYRNVLSFPPDHGPGVLRETVRAEPAERAALRLLSRIGWHGVAQVDFRWTGDAADPPWLIDVNPRFWSGLFQAIASGVDYPWLLFRLAIDGEVERIGEVAIGTRTELPMAGLYATLREVLDKDADLELLGAAFRRARSELLRGKTWTATKTLLSGLGETIDVDGRLARVKRLLDENAHNIPMLFDARDPAPVLGLVYPLAVFVRHGKLNWDLLSGSEDVPVDRVVGG